MYYYCQYLTGSLRGVKKILTDTDFKHPLQVFTPEAVNKNLKYKVLGDDKQYWYAGILFVAETPSKLNELIASERPRFNSRYLQTDSSSSDVNDGGPSKIDKSRQTARCTKIQEQILQKKQEVRANRQELPFKTPIPNPKYTRNFDTKKQSIPKKRLKVSHTNVSCAPNDIYQSSVAPTEPDALLPNLTTVASSKTLKNDVIKTISISVKTNLPSQNKISLSKPTCNSVPHHTITADKNHSPQKEKSTLSIPTDQATLSADFENTGVSKHTITASRMLRNIQRDVSSQKVLPSAKSTVPLERTRESVLTDKYKQNESQSPIVEEESNSSMRTGHCQDPICKSRILRSEKTISNLTKLLGEQLKIVEELRFELRDLRESKDELRQKLDNNYEEFQAKIFENNNKTSVPSPYPPSGFLRTSDKHIHLGRGVWLPRTKYNEASNVNSASLFVKLLCDMLFTSEELKESTVTGNNSNRKRGLSRAPKKLDPTKVLAIKDITKYWLETLNYSEEAVDVQVGKVKGYVSAKIAELQRDPNKKRGLKRSNKIYEGNITDLELPTPDENANVSLTATDFDLAYGDTDLTDNKSNDEVATQSEQDFLDSSDNDAMMSDENSNSIFIKPGDLEWEQLRMLEEIDFQGVSNE